MKAISRNLDLHLEENFNIYEVGMKLNPQDQLKIKTKLESLEGRAPSMSVIHLTFRFLNNQMLGELLIKGAGKEFYSKKVGSDPWPIYLKLEKEIDKQLIHWKKSRFSNHHLTQFSQTNSKVQTIGGTK